MNEDDVALSIAKQFFAYGLRNALSFPFAAGATAVLFGGRAMPEAISGLVTKHKVTLLGAVPTFLASWLRLPCLRERRASCHAFQTKSYTIEGDVSGVRLAGGEALPADLVIVGIGNFSMRGAASPPAPKASATACS